MHRQFNAGGIHKGDQADEFYEALEFPKIRRDLDTTLEAGDPVVEMPPNDGNKRLRKCCRVELGDFLNIIAKTVAPLLMAVGGGESII